MAASGYRDGFITRLLLNAWETLVIQQHEPELKQQLLCFKPCLRGAWLSRQFLVSLFRTECVFRLETLVRALLSVRKAPGTRDPGGQKLVLDSSLSWRPGLVWMPPENRDSQTHRRAGNFGEPKNYECQGGTSSPPTAAVTNRKRGARHKSVTKSALAGSRAQAEWRVSGGTCRGFTQASPETLPPAPLSGFPSLFLAPPPLSSLFLTAPPLLSI